MMLMAETVYYLGDMVMSTATMQTKVMKHNLLAGCVDEQL